MKGYFICFLILTATSINSCRFSPDSKNEAKNKNQARQAFADDSIIDISISGANKKFRINDSMAMELVKQVKEIKQILDYKYEDTTIFNEMYIGNIPTESDSNWLINIVQFQPQTNHASNLLCLKVNASNGNVSIWDLPKDTIISLDTWIKMKTKHSPD